MIQKARIKGTVLTAVLVCCAHASARAQDNLGVAPQTAPEGVVTTEVVAAPAKSKVEATLGLDVVSQFIWRGMKQGSAALQPTAGVSWQGLSLSAWGNVGFADWNDFKEIDLTLSYTIKGLTIGITDYWTTEAGTPYFNYKKNETNHVFEASVGYDFGFLRASWQTIFAGNDGLNKSDKRAYSSYFELTAPFRLATCDWEGTVGVVPYATSYYDCDGFRCTNITLRVTKAIEVTDRFKIPLFLQLTGNPNSRDLYFVGGFTLQAF